jgi:hypothetical protein
MQLFPVFLWSEVVASQLYFGFVQNGAPDVRLETKGYRLILHQYASDLQDFLICFIDIQ